MYVAYLQKGYGRAAVYAFRCVWHFDCVKTAASIAKFFQLPSMHVNL